MTGAINTVSSSLGTASSLSAQAPASSENKAAPASATPFHNPQIIQDPVAGFITEYVNTTNGLVVTQIPSAIAVAYLHQGLAADGTPKSSPSSVATA